MIQRYADQLETLYLSKNRRCYVDPDPLSFLYRYPDTADREIVGFIASGLAYGNVRQIVKSVERVLAVMGESPRAYLEMSGYPDFMADFSGFVHRFATGAHLAGMLSGLKAVIGDRGSLQACFEAGCGGNDITYLRALSDFSTAIRNGAASDPGHLVARVEKGSACKRLNLFLRWMVRSDAVDPGGWDSLCPSMLIVPMDVHMHRLCLELGFTGRRQANMNTALEVTAAFSRIFPTDPVRYDFVLTRRGIRKDDGFRLICP